MAREKLNGDMMDKFLGSPAKSPKKSRKGAGKVPDKSPDGPLKQHKIWLSAEDYQALKDHFRDKGLGVSAGIRTVLLDYLRGEGLRRLDCKRPLTRQNGRI